MGFGLKKKKTATEPSTKLQGNGLVAKIGNKFDQFAALFGEKEDAKPYLYAALAALLIALIFLLYLLFSIPRSNELTRSLGELRLLSQTISRQATEATTTGDKTAIDQLGVSEAKFQDNLETVHAIYGTGSDEIKKVDDIWKSYDAQVKTILAQQQVINSLYDTNIALSEVVPGIRDEYNLIVDRMVRNGEASSQVVIAKNQVVIAERILRSISSVLSGSDDSVASADDFSSDTETFGSYLKAQLNGSGSLGVTRVDDPSLRGSLQDIQTEYQNVLQPAANKVLTSSPQILQVREASNQIFVDSDRMLGALNELTETADRGLKNVIPTFFLLLSLAFFIVSLLKLVTLRGRADKVRVTRLQDEYDRNQNAILRLLDEIADLADGDLRSYATVSEDFTGAIADSINFAIDQLRDLVSRIHETSEEVSKYTQQTQLITNQLAEASEHQAQEIAGASSAINEMAHSIDQVSANARESAEVAKRSVEIATKGANVVNRTIDGMDVIREQIQETSKRIKRLGESSQEIGNIVSLINDIADQTNILALNAAIQASMAGEAGRGFAVVADEVQRLAERSASATKQIETLVKTIQTDTNEAVISMEQTTTEVVRGANLAKDAGVALDEIQGVSNTLASLIQNISEAANLQSASAGHIANTMNVVQEITSQTTTATFDTARSVSELADMAEALRDSVTDFKLPE